MVKVLSAEFFGNASVVQIKPGIWEHQGESHVKGELIYKNKRFHYDFCRKKGFVGNCASSPNLTLCQLVFPTYVPEDPLYDALADAHDWLYACKGEITVPIVTWERAECDDFLRGGARETPTMKKRKNWVARLCCGLMDFFVGMCAGGKSHWGNDTYCCQNRATMILMEAE